MALRLRVRRRDNGNRHLFSEARPQARRAPHEGWSGGRAKTRAENYHGDYLGGFHIADRSARLGLSLALVCGAVMAPAPRPPPSPVYVSPLFFFVFSRTPNPR